MPAKTYFCGANSLGQKRWVREIRWETTLTRSMRLPMGRVEISRLKGGIALASKRTPWKEQETVPRV